MIKSGQAVSATFTTHDPATGEAANATGTPVGTLNVNGTANGASVTVTNISTGRYKFAVTLPSLSPGDVVDVVIAATVDGVAGEGVVWSDAADTKRISDLNDVSQAQVNDAADAAISDAALATAAALQTVDNNVDTALTRLTADRAGYLDKLNVTGTLAHSDAANTYKADVSGLALEATAQDILTDTGTTLPGQIAALNNLSQAEAQTATTAALTAYSAATATDVTNATAGLATAASIAALNDLSAVQVHAEVVDALRVDMIPDDYSADGAQPTIAQALLEIRQFLMERGVSGTTITVRKPDGSTTAMTFTMDDAEEPTSITRAS